MSFRRFLAADHQAGRGASAEADGVAWLRQQGYRIVERNVRLSFGEIDVVALDGDTLCIIEIKARRSARYGDPLAAVHPAKQRRLCRLARAYLSRADWRGPSRFDVLGMSPVDDRWQYRLVRNAFYADR